MWSFSNPVAIAFGDGGLGSIGAHVAGRRYALVTYADPPFKALAARIAGLVGAPVLVVDDVKPNPDFVDLVPSCARFTGRGVELIVALGGGSVIDTAKVLAASDGDFARVERHLVEGAKAAPLPTPIPILAVPTTAGTGSEVTCWATVWDRVGGRKFSLADPRLYPERALVDPELTHGAPAGLTVATGLDALSHALESIWNRNANAVSATYAVAAAREIVATLPKLCADLRNSELRRRMAQAALFAGLAFSNTKTALAHSISYAVTLKHGVAHGLACSFTLPQVMRSVIGADADCDARLAAIFGDDLKAGADRLEAFLEEVGVSSRARDYGVEPSEWRVIIDAAIGGERGQNFIGRREAVIAAFALA
jgi:phosphonate metabolism-associated iron-containing alcohol dehydrogenase